MQEFLTACGSNDPNTVSRMLSSGFLVNSTDSDKRTGAHIAASDGHLDILRLLQKSGANFNMVCFLCFGVKKELTRRHNYIG